MIKTLIRIARIKLYLFLWKYNKWNDESFLEEKL